MLTCVSGAWPYGWTLHHSATVSQASLTVEDEKLLNDTSGDLLPNVLSEPISYVGMPYERWVPEHMLFSHHASAAASDLHNAEHLTAQVIIQFAELAQPRSRQSVTVCDVVPGLIIDGGFLKLKKRV